MIASIWEADIRYDEHLKAFAEGDYSRQLEVAKKMLAMGYDEDEIHTITELPIDEIRSFKHNPA